MTSPSRYRPSPNSIHGTASFDSDVYISGSVFVGGNISVSGAGEANTGNNLGIGEPLFQGKAGVSLNFRSLLGTGSVSILSGSQEITISGSRTPDPHAISHEDSGNDEIIVSDLFGELADPQKVAIRVNDGPNIGVRPRLNFHTGSQNITITAFDNIINDEIDIIISGSGENNVINGTRFYTSSNSDPLSPSPNAGDRYYNNFVNMEMIYDDSRGKWLSNECIKYYFGRNGTTAPGSFYKDFNGITFTSERGYLMPFSGTIISLTFNSENVLSSIMEILSNGIILTAISSSSNTGSFNNLNIDFLEGEKLSFRNQFNDGNDTINVVGSVRVKWRT